MEIYDENESQAESEARRMMRLFEGFSEAYGTYDGTVPNDVKGGKLEIKATAKTVRGEVTRELWKRHLAGDRPLGIIPIRDDDTCVWGVIDVDQYSIDLSDIVAKVTKLSLPLIPCRSKSGGCHLFLFMAEPVSATLIQTRLKEMAALLGYGSSEVFPKQRKLEVERGDLGSWLNMPYYGGDGTDRYAVKPGGLAMTVAEFLRMAESIQQPSVYLEQQTFRKQPKNDPDWGDGPPCMQHLAAEGVPEGMRNKGLFAMATFAKKKYGADWVQTIERWNMEIFHPPLSSSEVQQIIKSQERKEYNYTCKEHPLAAHCNSTLCRSRRFGVGGDDDYPVVSGLSVLETEPPLWFLDVDEIRLELTTDQLQNYKLFHKVCMEKLFKCFRMMKQESWISIVTNAMRDAVRIEVSDEISLKGKFYELLEEFVTNRHSAKTRDEILLGGAWHDEENGRYYFRMRDIEKFLENAGFRVDSRAPITARIMSIGGGKHFFNLKGTGVNTWWVPDKFRPMPKIDLPPIDREPI